MFVKFPDLDTLRLALTSGAIPTDVVQKAAVAGFGEQDQLWVETPAKLPAAAQKELKRLGALVCKASDASLSIEVSSWLELLPLVPDNSPFDTLEQTPVLFEVPGHAELSRLVVEMLRLGNDRQSFRWLEESSDKNGDGGRALLRVVGPPYYSLLRAIDQLGGPGVAPHAFVERAPGVWVELGHAHPLAANIRPPKGKLLLLRPPRNWILLQDAPFRDVYEIVEFQLPDGVTPWRDSPFPARLKVTPRLRQSGPADGAELWVLRGEAIDELNRFVQNVEDQLLTRLAFAVGEKNGQTIVVLRVRQSKLPPPVLVLPAEAYKSYLKLPNLFLPAGHLLHPPLRRDVVRKLLAEDAGQVTWLAAGDNGAFTPESLPEDVFRPLTDWVDYVLDRDREMLQAWVQAMQFDFEPFVCDEEAPPKPKKPPTAEKSRGPKTGQPSGATGGDEEMTAFEVLDEAADGAAQEADLEPFAAVEKIEPSELEKMRRAVEEEFLSLPGGLDDDAHQSLWPRLADLNARLHNMEEAGICWLNALWEPSETSNNRIGKWTTAWFRTEALGAAQRPGVGHETKRSWIARAVTPEGVSREVKGEDLDLLLQSNEPAAADVRALAAYLVWSASRNPRPAALMQRLQTVQRFLEKHEKLLPVRACWLAWYHLVQLLDGDVLALARARDRLLERLFHGGLRPEQDLPSFLRFAGQPTGQRFRDMREWMKGLCDKAHAWVEENRDPAQKPPMPPYINLLFAFGMARLGEADLSKQLMKRAQEVLAGKDDAHTFLLHSFEHRINEALEGKPHTGPLPAKQIERLAAMPALLRYVVDRLRKHSRILEPEQDIDPYSPWSARISDLDKVLVELANLSDRTEITARVQKLLKETGRGAAGHETRARILRTALEMAPRVGEDFAKEMLDRTLPAYDALPALETLPDEKRMATLEQQAKFLEKALFTAAHFGRTEHIHPLIHRFHKMLQTQRGPLAIEMVHKLASQCFRSLRKLGMREEIDKLLAQMANVVLESQDLDTLVKKINFKEDSPAPLQALLDVASSWYYFGRDHQADPVLQTVRAILFKTAYPPLKQRDLACAYARTLGQTEMEVAKTRLEEIFREVKGVKDSFTSGSHFSVCQLDLIESVVLAVVSDDFTQGAQARRWLDDDEFLVRRRIHDDHRKGMAQT
ncbi:MAG TPA: hypothetical protein VN688_19695 [Gemmataceae bacterium]|nr:hypothetical protein [Gemmataceae bacterium]